MPLGRRRKSRSRRPLADVGVYHDPPIRPLAPIGHVVDDGVLISLAAARLAVKNHLIVDALRDHRNFDRAALGAFAREAVRRLALENTDTARRLDVEGSDPDDVTATGNADTTGVNPAATPDTIREVTRQAHERRPEVHRRVASALNDYSDDPDSIDALVTRARDDAADELSREITRGLIAQRFIPESDYEAQRPGRLTRFIEFDLLPSLEDAHPAPARTRG